MPYKTISCIFCICCSAQCVKPWFPSNVHDDLPHKHARSGLISPQTLPNAVSVFLHMQSKWSVLPKQHLPYSQRTWHTYCLISWTSLSGLVIIHDPWKLHLVFKMVLILTSFPICLNFSICFWYKDDNHAQGCYIRRRRTILNWFVGDKSH